MNIRKVRQLTKQKWINLYEATYEHQGHVGKWVYASRQPQPVARRRADAVLIVPLLHAPPAPPRLVLIKEFRIPVAGALYAFPAGLLDEGESPEETARREMAEETGLAVTRIKKVSPLLFSTAGLTDESVVMVFVDVEMTPGGGPKLDKSEVIDVVLLDYDGVCRLAEDREALLDAKMWTVLHTYQMLGRLE